jgi:hypothetical protein
MYSDAAYATLLGTLRAKLVAFKPGNRIFDEIVAPRDEVFARFRPIFSLEHLQALTREEFTQFLYFENNRHWTGLYRQGLKAADDMPNLRASLAILLDEARPIRERFGEAVSMVNGMGKGIATAILTVAYPDTYGVWNNTSETSLRQLGAWPEFDHGEGFGGRYEKVNNLLRRLSQDLGIDLWTLDAAWWKAVTFQDVPPGAAPQASTGAEPGLRFGLERQLEEFLLENWERTPIGEEWSIHSSEDDPEAGNQFPTDIGPIDILARHKDRPAWLVIELKRDQSSDQTVGQALRYMGWVRRHLAAAEETVEALIIAYRPDRATRYALLNVPNVRMMTYEIDFRLRDLDAVESPESVVA